MLIEIYLMLLAATVISFAIGILNIFALNRESRMLWLAFTLVLIIIFTLSSFSVEKTSGATSYPFTELTMVIFGFLMGAITLLSIFAEAFGWMPQV